MRTAAVTVAACSISSLRSAVDALRRGVRKNRQGTRASQPDMFPKGDGSRPIVRTALAPYSRSGWTGEGAGASAASPLEASSAAAQLLPTMRVLHRGTSRIARLLRKSGAGART